MLNHYVDVDLGLTLRPLRIGITIGLFAEDESLWTNGIKQNAIFLAKALSLSPLNHAVCLLNTSQVSITERLPWDTELFRTLPFEGNTDGLDVLIELGGQISEEQTNKLRIANCKVVSYCCGPEYTVFIESMIFRRRISDHLFFNHHYDAIWVIPQVAAENLHFLQTIRRQPARVVPFVWDPMALEAAASAHPNNGRYEPSERARMLTIIEPNIDVLKFCLYPMLIAEEAYRRVPEKIGFLHVANANQMAEENNEFASVARQLDLVNNHKASFIGRVETPSFLVEFTDIVISHQWGLPLNYIYLECCWQGYALVHNAELVLDLGYYYPGNDVLAGAKQLMKAIDEHDNKWNEYRENQRKMIGPFLAADFHLIAQYDQLLAELVNC
jgi:hypothetical protein